MTSIVIYSSHRGNTQKIAEAIAEAANCKTVKLTKNFEPINLDGVDLVFFGTGIRGGEPYVELLNYINKANFDCGKRFALFMTWAGGGASNKLAYEGVKKALETK
ncbi:MAG: flavodoxin domain-containing protein, partial [Candidatus Bathyarchaeia archaeon]